MKKLNLLWKYIRVAVKRFRRIDENAKCPGCGHRRGRIKMIPEKKAMGHICCVCDAIWGEPTVIDTEKWL